MLHKWHYYWQGALTSIELWSVTIYFVTIIIVLTFGPGLWRWGMEAHWGTWTPWSWPPSALEPWWGWSLCHGSVGQECHTTGAVSHEKQLMWECDTQLGATPWLLVTDCQMRSVLSPQSGQCRYTVILYIGLDSTDMTVQCLVHIACCFRNLVLHWSYINFSRCLDITSMRIPACLSVVVVVSSVSGLNFPAVITPPCSPHMSR